MGVHIADVSYFVLEETALDKVASERATSVYLVQKVRTTFPFFLLTTVSAVYRKFILKVHFQMPEIFNTWLLLQQTYKNEQTDVNTRANTADYLGDYKESRG